MTWRLKALVSGGGLLATYLSLGPSVAPRQWSPTVPQAVAGSGAAVDLTEQADRLREGVAQATAYRQPVRNAFRFGGVARRAEARPAPTPAVELPSPVASPPPRPPFALAGIAVDSSSGVTQRTAILSSLRGVLVVREGEVIDGAYRVVAIGEDAATLESTTDGTRTTIRLSP